jgi:hypothetical protein
MSYSRVIPRDLFNEANLLKCYGQLYLKLERYFSDIDLRHEFGPFGSSAFNIRQDPADGSLTIANICLVKGTDKYELRRPLNSREPWPLYCVISDDRETAVFDDNGELAEGFLEFLRER